MFDLCTDLQCITTRKCDNICSVNVAVMLNINVKLMSDVIVLEALWVQRAINLFKMSLVANVGGFVNNVTY